MLRLNAGVGISGDVLDSAKRLEQAIEKMEKIAMEAYTVAWVGGGIQLNREFELRGWPIKYGPFGRECETIEQKLTCKRILEKNRDSLQDVFDIRGIPIRVETPINDEANVVCPVNVDLKLCQVYIGYDKLFRFTLVERVETKVAMFKEVAKAFNLGKGDPCDKIKVLGF